MEQFGPGRTDRNDGTIVDCDFPVGLLGYGQHFDWVAIDRFYSRDTMNLATHEQAKAIVQALTDRLLSKLPSLITSTAAGLEITIHISPGGGQAKIIWPPLVDSIKI